MGLALSLPTVSPWIVLSAGFPSRTVQGLKQDLSEIGRSYRGDSLIAELQKVGVYAGSLWAFKDQGRPIKVGRKRDYSFDAEVLGLFVEDDDLWRRYVDARGRTFFWTPHQALALPTPPTPWSASLTTYFGQADPSPPSPPLVGLWRTVRDISDRREDGLSMPRRRPVEAGAIWAEGLEQRGLLRRVGPAEVERNNDQILRWLGVKKVPEGRSLRDLYPSGLGFRDLQHGPSFLLKEPAQPGDLVIYHDAVFAGAAVLTKVAPLGRPAEVAFLLGGLLCLAPADVPGDFTTLWRLQRPPPDYLVVSKSPYDDPTITRVLDLDKLLEVEEAIRFGEKPFRATHRNSGPGISSGEWVVLYRFGRWDFAILHLGIERGREDRALSVVIDYHSGREESHAAKDRLAEFNAVAEKVLLEAARPLGFPRLDLFYKTVMPLSIRGEGREELVRLGYREMNHPGWGRLPGKRIAIQNKRRSRR